MTWDRAYYRCFMCGEEVEYATPDASYGSRGEALCEECDKKGWRIKTTNTLYNINEAKK